MHIGFVSSELAHSSGWAHYSLNLIDALTRAGVHVTVVAARSSPDVDGLALHKLLPNVSPAERFMLPRMLSLLPRVRSLLKSCDLIHVTAEPYGPLGMWIAGRRPFFLTAHGSYVHVDHYRRWPVNLVYKRAFYRAQVVCVSHYTARIAQSVMPGIHTAVVNNGIDPARFATLPELAEPKRGPTILTVGGVKARKGTLELVQAVAVVREQIPAVQCVILGNVESEPGYVARVREVIAELDLADCVHMPGFVSEATLLGWYGAADVFVMPSINAGWKFEGYGLAHMEASAAGLPVIGTTDCGAEDAIDDGQTGLLIPQDQVAEKLPQAVLDILNDPERAYRMGQAGQAKAQNQTWDHVAQAMIVLYEKVLENNATTG